MVRMVGMDDAFVSSWFSVIWRRASLKGFKLLYDSEVSDGVSRIFNDFQKSI